MSPGCPLISTICVSAFIVHAYIKIIVCSYKRVQSVQAGYYFQHSPTLSNIVGPTVVGDVVLV